MGCGASRLDGNGMVLPAKFRPLFLPRLEEMKMRRHASRPLKDSISTNSNKELFFHDRDEDETVSQKQKEPKEKGCDDYKKELKDERKHAGKDNKNDQKESKNIEDVKAKEEAFTDADNEDYDDDDDDDDYDDDDDDERMIGHDDDRGFPGSPSFRVYFHDDGKNDHNVDNIGKNNAFRNAISSSDALSSKVSSENKKAKRERKKKSFRKVLPKGKQSAAKNSSPSHTHLLTGKTTA